MTTKGGEEMKKFIAILLALLASLLMHSTVLAGDLMSFGDLVSL